MRTFALRVRVRVHVDEQLEQLGNAFVLGHATWR